MYTSSRPPSNPLIWFHAHTAGALLATEAQTTAPFQKHWVVTRLHFGMPHRVSEAAPLIILARTRESGIGPPCLSASRSRSVALYMALPLAARTHPYNNVRRHV